jgi:hypothetical protein
MLFTVILLMRRDERRKAQPEEEWVVHVMRSLATTILGDASCGRLLPANCRS